MEDGVRHTDQRPRVPPSIYAALVDSLFENPIPMVAGAACSAAAAVMTAWRTGEAVIWPIAAALIVIGLYRAMQLSQYQRLGMPLNSARARQWEMRYMIGGGLYAGALGLWCFVVLIGSDDAVAHMFACSVTMAYTAAGAGRTYGRPSIARLQVILACAPMSVGLLLNFDGYYAVFALLNVLFFVGLRRIWWRLHDVYLKALTATERVASIASQFDTALNNMPHGLCMFEPQGGLAVVNQRFADMMGLPPTVTLKGLRATDVMAACADAGAIPEDSALRIALAVDHARAGEIVSTDPEIADGRAFAWTVQPMANGGSVVLVEDITERRNAEARISYLARFDELTGLPNRVHFRDEVARLLANASDAGQSAALLFIDLDQFKQVNDTLGHPCGDQLLCAVTNRLRGLLAPGQLVARFGGDEFVVFQQYNGLDDAAADLARRIVDRLSERYEINRQVVEIGASIGIAVMGDDIDADTLIKQADMALHRAKADGRGTYCFFRDEMALSVETRRILELDLRRALEQNEFELYYQPLVNLKSGRITTCEALLRWNHPERGLVSPIDIVPVAEDMGLIIELGQWILNAACEECARWPDGVSVAVNFSPQQFHHPDVLREVRDALQQSKLAARRLEIEITESSLLSNTEKTHDALANLREAGVRISLDDFGTGYSSLSYLHNFPLNKVKIDRSFLEGIDTARPLTLLRGIARLSADLGMSVVVEGVETNHQLDIVAADGTVTEVQGYLFSRPVPAPRIRQLLAASHARPAGQVPVIASPAKSIA